MLSVAYSAPDWLFKRLGSRLVDTSYEAVEGYLGQAAGLSDEELRAECARALEGDELRARFGKPARPSLVRRVARFGRPDRTSIQLRYLALAVEAFRRHPADLPPGSQLYPHQVRAAIALTQPCALQMDTGEGKTYAALPAAFALACEFGRVYIICANRYLAWRDARRTQLLWAAVGVSASYAAVSTDSPAWGQRIVYTTIRDLIFHDQRNEISAEQPPYPIVPGAVLLDEIDAILLDGADQNYDTIRRLAEAPFKWEEAIQFAERLEPADITADFASMMANLTVNGEARLRAEWAMPAAASHRYLLARYAVELSYVAVRMAEQDRDYVVKDDRVVSVDRRTGQLDFGSRLPWLLPLEARLHLQRGFRSVTLTRSDPKRVLRRFRHLAGMSGSAEEDFLDYMFQYLLMPITIPPRHPRRQGLRSGQTFRTHLEAHRAVLAHVKEAVAARRPVLVGTQTIEDAEAIFNLVSAAFPADTAVHLLTGKNEQAIAAVLERAGEVGSIVVATQVVGRGVDIRLSPEAKGNGGLALIAAGHAIELRHDRQFLGRAGRQGDPYTAIFVSSLEDGLMTRFGGARIQQMMQRLGMAEGEAIEGRTIDSAVRRAQGQIRMQAFISRQAAALQARTLVTAHEGIRAWFESLQSESDAYPEECGPAFVDWLASDYIGARLLPICGRVKHVGTTEAERVMDTLCTDLSVPREALRLGPLDVEGHSTSVVRERLLGALRTMVTEAAVANRAAREAWGRPHDEAAAAQEPTSFWVTLRTPRRIAVESLIAIWSQFLGDCDSHRFRIMQLGLTPVAFYQRVDQAIDQEWRRVRDLLPAKVLANLVAGARLETVNDLFFTVEHQQPESGSPDESFRPPDPIETTPASPPPSPSRVTVLEFLAATSEAAGSDSAKVAEFRRTILDFAKDASTSQLQTPHRILAAMARWSKDESDRGMTAEQRRLHMTWIRDYLKYLRRRGLIAPLPTMAQRAWWHVDGLVQSVMTETSLITLAGLILFVSAFVTATLFGRIPGLVLHGKWVAFDYLLCAGLLQAGALTSVAFPGLLLGRGALLLITPNSAQAPRAVPFERLAVLAVQVALAIWMTPWSGGGADLPAAARAAAVFAGCLLIAVITNSLTWFIDQKAGVAMDGIFLAVGIAVAFVPWLARASAASVAALGVFALAMAATALGPLLNRVSLQLATARIDVSGSVVRSEEVLTTSTISGSIGFPAYLFALLLAISVAGAVGSSRWEGAVLYGVYAATLAGITIRIIATRTNAEYWTSNLNATRSVIVGVDEVTGIEAFLGRLRWVLVGRALALEAVLVGAGLFLIGWNARLATLPATPLVLLAACLLVDAARPSVASLGRLVLGLGRYQAQELNIEDVTAPDEAATLWQRLKKLKGGRLYTVLAFVVFVMQVVPLLLEPFTQKNVLELLKLLKEILK